MHAEFDKRTDVPESEMKIYGSQEPSAIEKYLSGVLSYSTVTDASEVARRLLGLYGSLDAVLSRDYDELAEHAGASAATLLKLVAYVSSRRVYDEFKFGRCYSDSEIIDLLLALMTGLSRETVYMVSLDKRGAVIACDMIGEGTVNASDVYPRRLVERAVKRGATSVFLAHNHPSGTAEPSSDDLHATARVFGTLRASGIRLRAHAVIASRDVRVMVPDEDTGDIKVFDTL